LGRLDGKVAVVTGAGRGVGRGHALELARQGAAVVVNDLDEVANEVVAEIERAGGQAAADHHSVADFAATEQLIGSTVERFGDLNILVNNAGILRDRMVFNMEESDWDSVVAVHGKGHFGATRFACAYWREKSKATGAPIFGRLVHTTSRSGLFSAPGQTNYDFAKAGIASFSIAVAREMERYGVTSNAIAPVARTRLTEGTFGEIRAESDFDRWDAENVAPFVAYLCSAEAAHITGQIFVVFGGEIELIEPYQPAARIEKPGRWTVDELVTQMGLLFAGRSSQPPDRRAIL
jgi:NAD(P)-dependent dehydrogenase (short-subunit alcohol dehydrogenase family)